MSTPDDNKRQQLISKLNELFPLNPPDHGFGLYRIMHAKARRQPRAAGPATLGVGARRQVPRRTVSTRAP